jgi:hypothetical protein
VKEAFGKYSSNLSKFMIISVYNSVSGMNFDLFMSVCILCNCSYYGFDDHVMREIMGKKLSSRQRKDLDEVSEKTGVNLRSCR